MTSTAPRRPETGMPNLDAELGAAISTSAAPIHDDVHDARQRAAAMPARSRQARQHDEPCAVAQRTRPAATERRRHRSTYCEPAREHAGPGGRDSARHDQAHALRPALPADGEQQRQDQEPHGREAIGDEADARLAVDGRWLSAHRAPLPHSTTSTVCTRIARSNSRLRFLT